MEPCHSFKTGTSRTSLTRTFGKSAQRAISPGFVFFAAVALLAIGTSIALAGFYPLASLVALAVGGICGALARAARVGGAPHQGSTFK